MPFVSGESLRERLRRGPAPSVTEALRIVGEIADALAHAHRHGVVHRDVKPENVLLADGHAVLADFGIARAIEKATAGGEDGAAFAREHLTATGISLGTPGYMAPEQLAGDVHVDARVDVYALGVVAYEMLAGASPFAAATPQAVLAAQFGAPPRSLTLVRGDVPPGVSQVIATALATEPGARFPTAAEFRDALAAPAAVGEAGRAAPGSEAGGRRTPATRRRLVAAGAAALVAVALGGGSLLWTHSRDGREVASAGDPPAARSIAVLPLANVGGDSSQEYFADGMTDELTTALGSIPGLRVAARSSAYSFKGRTVDLREVGRRLHVGAVLEGSVRRAGPRLRVSAQLVNTRDGLALWAQTYEREQRDVFRVQEDIAQSIASALRLTLGAGQAGAAKRIGGTRNLEAYDLYLKGRSFLYRSTEADLRRSLTLFHEALAIDSGYALAWAGIADAWVWLSDDYLSPHEGFPRAKEAALRALALDSTLAEAQATLGLVERFYEWDHAAGARALQRAIALNPSVSSAYLYWGLALMQGPAENLDSALKVTRRAEAVDPLNAQMIAEAGWILLLQGRNEDAIAECRRALELDPTSSWTLQFLAEALLAAGRPQEALASLRDISAPPDRVREVMARALVALGRRGEARAMLRTMERDAARRYDRPESIAAVYAALGDADAAFRWLEKAYDARSSNVSMIRVERQRWAPLRDDPRLGALVRRVGIP
jgi:serine/threonine-protein kinase